MRFWLNSGILSVHSWSKKHAKKSPPAYRDQTLPFTQCLGGAGSSLCYLLYTAVTAYLSISSLIKSSFFRTNWRGISSSSLNVFCRNEEKTIKYEITSWYFFIRHSTKQMKGWNNDGTYHLRSHTQCKGNNQSPLFCAWPIEGVLSQHQSREDIQALLTVLFIRNHPFLNDKKTQKFREKFLSPKAIAYYFFPKLVDLS